MLIIHTASGDGYDGVAGAEVTVLIQDDDPIPVQPGDQGGGTAEDQGWFDPPGFGRW